MPHVKQRDNAGLGGKLALRTTLCSELHAPLRVLDLFSGEGHIWRKMRERLPVATYTAVDVKPRQPGAIQMKVDGRTVRGFDLSKFNVIDVDAYGDPWDIVAAVWPAMRPGTAIFITFGHLSFGGMNKSLNFFLRRSCGIPDAWDIPTSSSLNGYLGHHFFQRLCAQRAKKVLQFHKPKVAYYGALV